VLLEPGGVELLQAALGLDEVPFVWITSEGELGPELCEGGLRRALSEDNKLEYVQLLCEFYLVGELREQMQAFLSGFHEVVPAPLLAARGIDHVDLALALQGALEIDVDDWQQHTIAPANLNETWPVPPQHPHKLAREHEEGEPVRLRVSASDMMGWFWQCVREMDPETRARLLGFATGLSAVPVGGFKNLRPRLFNIVVDPDPRHLPSAVTCFAQLRLPLARDQTQLQAKLLLVCSQRHLSETFGEK
jgi:E3 ubiquitin-protein ligase NEDD4